jgi:flagellar basal body-associated protein FliL
MSKLSEERDQQATRPQGPRWIWLLLALATAVLAWGIYYFVFYQKPVSTLDAFAKCLTAKGAKMYGAWWCPHCAEEKELFGNAFQYVNYVECSPAGERTQNDVCKQAAVKNYPTWQFADDSRMEGMQPLMTLSKKTGCPLP